MSDGEERKRKVALIDLLARVDGFMSNDSLAAIGARLERDGHEVVLLRSVLADDAAGDLAVWNQRLATFIGARNVDVVVMPRAWDASTIAALRGAAPQARFVRLTSGISAALDDRFDHVLHFPALLAFLGGNENPVQATWIPMTPRELRAGEERRMATVPMPAAGETHYEQLPGANSDTRQREQRPTITGPAAGCPFLLDSRKSDIYKNLAVDDNQVQMKGCTFCLDNVGTYTAPSADAMVGSWISQLRIIRAQRNLNHRGTSPDALPDSPNDRIEVLCTDERPHPYLPALFRALAAEPSLGPIELLIKSRVDWLLEFADNAMSEALVEAKSSRSLLHVYLVGFESFDPFHLELFNKGVTAEDNIAAVEKLRELAARFPDTFEYLRYRAHGIVLFTPWTRPEHLLESARRMRQVRFHELRSEALRTRLRLYPRVPLHALAERDGLLVDKFEEGRTDRAAEQGYDASVPWRFADPRTEAIFRVAQTPELRRRSYTDADVLEAVTRFVLRWPGLASVPELASLPFEQAMRIWSPSPSEQGASSLGFDPELDAIRVGVKVACLKEAVPGAISEQLVTAYRAMGLAATVVARHGLSSIGDVHGAGDDFVIVAVARDEETLARVVEAQRAHRGRDLDAARLMGALMSYPSCCTDAFLAQRERGDNLENERCTFRRAPDQALHPLVNRFAVVRLTSHHLCTPSCAESVHLAEALLASLDEQSAESAAWVRDQLSMTVLVPDYIRRVGLRGAWQGDVFCVDEAIALDDKRKLPGPMAGVTRVTVSPEGAVLGYRDGSSVRFQTRAPILVTPGSPLSPTAWAAIEQAPSIGPAEFERSEHHHDRIAPPPLPSTVRPGMEALGYRIVSIRTVPDAERGSAHEVVLDYRGERLVLRLRAHDPARTPSLRRGAWAIDVETPRILPERARAALVLITRALPT